ncbi:MAG: OST-HTH/LOTUS domain-containing protein, partial [Pseudomonadota bacterium]
VENPDDQDDGIQLVLDTADALIAERGNRVFGSMVKQTLKRRHPGFSETSYGFSSFNDLLGEAQERGHVELEADERSGGYVVVSVNRS